MNPLSGKEVVLGVTGGIAAYKAAEITRQLVKRGAGVTAVMTDSATRFLGTITLETLTGRPVVTSLWSHARHDVEHIALSDRADLVIVAPATANIIGKYANGIADDFLSTFLLSCNCPVLIAPAMNCKMWDHPAVQANMRLLRERQVDVIDPEPGALACGYEGQGRLAAPDRIVRHAGDILFEPRDLDGKTVLITTGPTREQIDPARFISNPSSGKMGDALAEAARRRGARVIGVRGPCSIAPPEGIEVIEVVTAREMHDAVMTRYLEADVIIMAAAVADYRPRNPAAAKMKKRPGENLELTLAPTEDILEELGRVKGSRLLAGFAAETDDLIENARKKLERKNADVIVANRIGAPGTGFQADTNRAVLLARNREPVTFPLLSKELLAHRIIDQLIPLLDD